VHPDVRRTLLTIRAFNEAARAMVVWTALKSDVAHRSSDPKDRQEADDHMGLMTPVMKGVMTDVGFSNAVLAQQMYGGHGYIAEQGMEQFVRDARIAMLYEGANGIQALDLVGRKLPRDGGRAVMSFFGEVAGFAKDHGADEAMKPYVAPLSAALGHLQQATTWLMQNAMAKPDNAESRARQDCGRRHDGLFDYQAGDRPLLHGTDAAGNIGASCAHPDRKRDHHGIGGGSVLIGEILPRRSTRSATASQSPIYYDPHTRRASCLRHISTITFARRAAAARPMARCMK
jgi:hypothetical protein